MADNAQKAKLEEEKLKDGAEKLVAGIFDMTTKAVADNTNVANFPNIVSVEAVKQANAKESGIYRSPLLCGSATFDLVKTPVKEEGYPGFGIDADDGSYDTVVGCFEATAKKNGNNNFLGHREVLADGTRGDYKWCNYADALEDVKAFGVGLSTLCSISATAGKSGDAGQPRVGVYSINRPEVTKVILALFRQRLICCPLYDTLGPKSVEFILNQADVSVVFCERTKLKNLLEGKGKNLKFVILFEDLTDADKDAAKTAKVKLFSLSDLKNSAAGKSAAPVSTLPADWAYIMYTSGTTGDPKGVCLSHQNMLASASGLIRGNLTYLAEASDVYISYLPMAHSMEICCQMSMIVSGASIGFYSGDVRKLVSEDLPALKPTIMAGVPRVYSRIYDKVMQGLEEKGTLAGYLYKVAYMNQSWHMAAGLARNPIWDWLLFNKVKEALGGRVRLMATGAAPLSKEVHEFLQVVFGCPVQQGYGMTENFGAAVCQPLGYSKTGNVGGPLPCTEVKLMDTEDYTSADVYPKTAAEFESQYTWKGAYDASRAGKNIQRGEVCLRGTNIMVGYYKMEKETKEVLLDGWLHTGDIGMWNEDGSLQIIDRKKAIFKLSQGEYVSPEAVEGAVGVSKWVGQVFVYGNSFETCVVAVVVPDMEVLSKWVKSNKGDKVSVAEAVKMEDVRKMILDDMIASGKQQKLRGFELPKDVTFETEVNELGQGFTVENELLTPSMKLKRPQLTKRYQKEFDAMYKKINEKPAE